MFVKLMQDYRLRELFKPSMAELGLCMYQFEYMIQVWRAGDRRDRARPRETARDRFRHRLRLSSSSASQEQLPELHVHFQAQSFHTSMYASSWFLTIFLTSFPLPVATRIFDIFMCEVGEKKNNNGRALALIPLVWLVYDAAVLFCLSFQPCESRSCCRSRFQFGETVKDSTMHVNSNYVSPLL